MRVKLKTIKDMIYDSYDVEVLADRNEIEMEILNDLNRGYQRFDRHLNMSDKTRHLIMDLISDVRFSCGFDLTNYLYGLFDGYYYYDLLPLGKKTLKPSLYKRLEKVVHIIENYPTLLG